MIVVILCGLINITGCQSEETEKKSKSNKPEGVVIDDYNVKDLSLDVKKFSLDDEDFASFKEKNSGENVTKDYVTQLLLDKLYPISQTTMDSLIAEEKKDRGDWKDYLKSQDLTDETYSNKVKYTEQIKRLVTDTLVINDEVLKEYYDATVTTNTSNIQHLLVKDTETADKMYKKLKQGDDFAALAKEYSLDTATKEQGGLWSDYRPGTSLEVVDEEIGNLTDVGQVSKPFKSVLGWHIVKLQELKNATSFEEVKAEVKGQYIESKMTFNYIKILLNQLIEENMNYFDKDIQKELTKEEESDDE